MKFCSAVTVALFSVVVANHTALAADTGAVIGVSASLTGPIATAGTDLRNTLILANDLIAGGKYKLVFEDDKCSAKDGVAVAHKLVGVDRVRYVLGFLCSGTLLSSQAIYEKAGVVTISSTSSAPAISCMSKRVFRTWPSDVMAARTLGQYVSGRHKNPAVLFEETEYPTQLAKAFREELGKKGLLVHEQSFISGTTDFRPLLLKILSRQPDAIFLDPQSDSTLLLILKNLRELKISASLYGAFMPGSDAFLKAAGADAEGIRYVDLPASDEVATPLGKEVLAKFRERFGNPAFSDIVVLTSYEAFSALVRAIQSGEDVPAFLSTRTFNGIFGDYRFDACGDIEGLTTRMRIIRNGKPVAIE